MAVSYAVRQEQLMCLNCIYLLLLNINYFFCAIPYLKFERLYQSTYLRCLVLNNLAVQVVYLQFSVNI